MRIGVFCSGGDAPGMNPCVRAVVRTGISLGHEIVGIRYGYRGILEEKIFTTRKGEKFMSARSVSNISKAGGTILNSSRCPEFRTEEGQKKAAKILKKHKIDAIIPIGGDGSLHGAVALAQFWDGQIIGCPGTIDNDLIGTDFTIGFATAVTTAVEAVDKIRDTADSHERLFVIEVMGRHSGYIATYTALAAGAEVVCIPETPTQIERIDRHVELLKNRGKSSIMIIVAEGDETGGAEEVNRRLAEAGCPYPTRAIILGHLQRGGSPVPADRILGTRCGDAAIHAITKGKTGLMAGVVNGKTVLTPFEETYAEHRAIPNELLQLLESMSN